MASAKKAIPNILRWEGGYSSHPADTDGGCTMKGITLITFRHYYGKGKTCDDLKRITDEQWMRIFRDGYWDRLNGDKIENQSIADLCADMCWGSGTITAIKKIQRCLGTTPDGIVGPKTLALLNGSDRAGIHSKLKEMRRIWFLNIVKAQPAKKVFLKGWLRRLDSFTYSE